MTLRSLLLLFLLTANPAWATNTDKHADLRVTLEDGTVREGRAALRDKKLEVRGKKIPYRRVASIRDRWPPSKQRLEELRAEHARRAKRVEDARGWVKLGTWARKQGLESEAVSAFERAVAVAPDDTGARRGLGHIRQGEQWLPGAEVVARRRAELKPKDLKGLLDLARFAIKAGARDPAFDLLTEALRRAPMKKRPVRMMRPLTDRYVQKTRMWLPVRGRWKASEDPTRHHSKNGGAAYALDLLRVDESGAHFGPGDRFRRAGHYSWDQPFHAAADGTVVMVREGFPDLAIGVMGDRNASNTVAVDHGNGEITWYVHARKGSITVKRGDQVKRGQVLGKVGNSGKSVIPHLHFALSVRGFISVPWACEEYVLHPPDGSAAIRVERACPREGWTFEHRPAQRSE